MYNNDIRKVVQEGTVFQSEAFLYAATRQMAARDANVRSSANILGGDLRESANKSIGLFEVVQLQTSDKFVIKVYDREEEHSFHNEVEKLELLNSIMSAQGIENSPIVHMFEAFTCQVGQQEVVHCIVFEHLEVSLADIIDGARSQSRASLHGVPGDQPLQTMDYSLSEEYEHSMTPDTHMRSASR